LRGENYFKLATFRKTGLAVETPVWFAAVGRKYYVFSAADAGKVKRLRNSPRSRVAACNVRGAVHGQWLDTEAHLLDDDDEIAIAHRALLSKYKLQMRFGDFLARLSGRINRRAWIRVELI
jgi:PPOX class probable F420-dependent enzyme